MGKCTARAGVIRLLAAAALGLAGLSPAFAACAPDRVDLRGAGSFARFSVELAETVESQRRGLMFRDHMPSSAGMLFIYPTESHAVFWMKNTLIPLDMVFLDATGTVTRVHSNAVPHDETPIDGGVGVLAVLEINGGLARRLGIKPGDEMRHPAFSATSPAWPCD